MKIPPLRCTWGHLECILLAYAAAQCHSAAAPQCHSAAAPQCHKLPHRSHRRLHEVRPTRSRCASATTRRAPTRPLRSAHPLRAPQRSCGAETGNIADRDLIDDQIPTQLLNILCCPSLLPRLRSAGDFLHALSFGVSSRQPFPNDRA